MCVGPSAHCGDCAEHPEPCSVKRTPLRRPPRSPLINYTRTHVPEQHFFIFCAGWCVCVRTPNFSVCVWECAGLQMICLSFFFLYSDFTWILRRKKIAWQSSRNSRTHMCVPIEDNVFRKNMTLHVSGAQLTRCISVKLIYCVLLLEWSLGDEINIHT